MCNFTTGKGNAKETGNAEMKASNVVENRVAAHAITSVHQNDDEWKDNPDQVDKLLSKELYELSLKDRNDSEDEIHGVLCIAPEETPELIRTSLEKLEHELEYVVPLSQKTAYLEAKKLKGSYIHGDDFKLRFLRCELFDVSKAAVRMALFLELLNDLFGSYALQRPIRMSDFSKNELNIFRKGTVQLLPDRDRGSGTGRRILCLFPDEEWEKIPATTRHKITLYTFYVAGNDVDAQRKGVVLVLWMDRNRKPSWKPAMRTKIGIIPSVRISAVHVCSPDTPFYRLRRSLIIMAAGKSRERLRVHIGEPMELRYKLQGFGLPGDKIPITYSGSIKTANLKKWMRTRRLHEDKRLFANEREINPNSNGDDGDGSSSSSGTERGMYKNNKSNTELIDSPYLTDIIFRKGKAMSSHPGNIALRRLIKGKIESGAMENENNTTRTFIHQITQELKKNSTSRPMDPPPRLLLWDEAHGNTWKEIDDEDTIYNRIRHIVKEYQREVREAKQRSAHQTIDQVGGISILSHPQNRSTMSLDCKECSRRFKKPRLTDAGDTMKFLPL